MQIISRNYGHYFNEYSRSYPTEFHEAAGYSETHVQLADEVSQGELGEFCFQGVRIHYGQFQTLKADTICSTEDFSSVEMMFLLQGHISHESSLRTRFASQQHNLSYRPYGDVRSLFETGDYQYVGVQLTETFFSQFADDTAPLLNQLMNHMARRETVTLSDRNLPITPALQKQLIDVMQTNRPQPLKRLYLEMTVLDLLRQQLEQAEISQSSKITTLKTSDVEKIIAVKNRLDSRPFDTYSLLQLSRYVGLNDYKLKKGFRELLGTTVFGYLSSIRMDYAHQLLRSTNQTIGEIALTLGYSESHHFSTAFQRKFGYLPSQLRSGTTSSDL
ncbi:helix-turn-helix transcriptional regulator [Spirosoma sp. BT702]|uniref:Helix-turn-helix transcriptional regulator n=1 Tax=Spirosoma profusum TaxID=2771354 RepID=A0A926XUT8_9BACT|nr:helix-turn-helix transcriptional regulator [Spirosoma profusum]MBD2700524.1 helix-turn-helix transcriptional regulator [Spirosoma profusum]